MKMKVNIQKEIVSTGYKCGSHDDGFEVCPGNGGSSYCDNFSAILKMTGSRLFPYLRCEDCLEVTEETTK